jgi:hypothetical protein
LVTGAHRSGSTWIGKTISYSLWTHYLGELFNPNSPYLCDLIPDWFHYVTAEDSELFGEAIQAILDYQFVPTRRKSELRWLPTRLHFYRLTRRYLGYPRPILKDPIAVFSSEWLADRFNMDVICIIRHPAAFVHSLKKVGWDYDYRAFLRRRNLLDDLLFPYLELLSTSPGDIVHNGSILWLCIYQGLRVYSSRNPEWSIYRFEDIALDPQSSFSSIYEHLGLPLTPWIRWRIKDDTKSTNPIDSPTDDRHLIKRNSLALRDQWKSLLEPEEVRRIRSIVEPLSCNYYDDGDW